MKPLFLNVDLDIISRKNLAPLIAALGRRVIVLHSGRIPQSRNCILRLELATSPATPDRTIRGLCAAIESLPLAAQSLWRTARKEFNVGYELRPTERISSFSLRPETLKRIAKLDARLGVTYYRGVDETPQTQHQQEQAKKLRAAFHAAYNQATDVATSA